MSQKIYYIKDNDYTIVDSYLKKNSVNTLFLVCDNAIKFLKYDLYFKDLENRMNIKVIKFDDFRPNPDYSSVEKGVKKFLEDDCDMIFAIGGGSAIDVAKCIKLYLNMDHSKNYLTQNIVPNDIKLAAIPTTAGTGSEATKYAVVYYNGEKQSVTHESCIPTTVFMDSSVLETLPEYQKKATMLDALCHAIESFWSVNSNEESKAYSKEAIQLILDNKDLYFSNDIVGNENMLKASHIAGKAINVTQTTAGHAMCYKMTSLYGIAHGHAAALCVSKLWKYMINNADKCIDSRGQDYLIDVFNEIAEAMGCNSPGESVEKFGRILYDMGIESPAVHGSGDFELLDNSVNPVRLKNNPVELDLESIDKIYHEILK